MFTRKQYMAGECSHREYYAQFVAPRVLAAVSSVDVRRLIKCSDQENFNTIPLSHWDQLEVAVRSGVDRQLLRAAGETWSPATSVCIAKEAAHQLVDAYKEENQRIACLADAFRL